MICRTRISLEAHLQCNIVLRALKELIKLPTRADNKGLLKELIKLPTKG